MVPPTESTPLSLPPWIFLRYLASKSWWCLTLHNLGGKMSSPLVVIPCKRPSETVSFLFCCLSLTELYCVNWSGGQLIVLGICEKSKWNSLISWRVVIEGAMWIRPDLEVWRKRGKVTVVSWKSLLGKDELESCRFQASCLYFAYCT